MPTETTELIPTALAVRRLLKGEVFDPDGNPESYGEYHEVMDRLIVASLVSTESVKDLWRYEAPNCPQLASAVRGQPLPKPDKPQLLGIESIEGDTLAWVATREARMLVEEAGISSCVIVPHLPVAGAKVKSKLDYLTPIESKLEPIRKHFYLLPNHDGARRLRDELARRIGPERAWMPMWPSECDTVEHISTIYGVEVLREVLASMQPFPIRGIITFGSLRQQLKDAYEGIDPYDKAVSPGWKNLEKIYRVRPGEITLLQGSPNVGKSTFMSAMVANMIELHQWPFAVFSPEHGRPLRYAETLISQWTGWPFRDGPTERMGPITREEAITELDSYISLLWPEDETPTLDLILSLARQQVFRHSIKGLVIDPWGKLVHQYRPGQREDQYVAECLTKIHNFATQRNVHVWIIVHPKQLLRDENKNYPVPKPYDINGGASWFNYSDNILSTWRNMSDPDLQKILEVHTQKIRFPENGVAGKKIDLRIHRHNFRFSEAA